LTSTGFRQSQIVIRISQIGNSLELWTQGFSFSAVSQFPPSVSIVIAARPDQADVKAVAAAQRLDYPSDRIEIILARGKQPSAQRNAAVKAATGDWIYFLDDDSVPPRGNLRQAAASLADSAVKMLGGPNLCPPDAPFLERVFAGVLASWLAFGPSRARYAAIGAVRQTGEKELILCNLMVHRLTMIELGGFNEALYPNEENALMDHLQQRGAKLIYDPEFFVYRRPRRTLASFARMLSTYGRGRAEQFRVHPTPGSALNFLPPLFVVYLAALLALALSAPASTAVRWGAAPLLVYGLAVLLQTAASALGIGLARALAGMPLLVAAHLLYGVGFWRGLFTRLNAGGKSRPVEVRLDRF
jgi:cellulose synthase/poly-beta-1,6-N-acetylglucosamine synthase-like glycosyltransferase